MSKYITAEKIEVLKLFKDYSFIIPDYQRHYVWEKDNIIALLEDLNNTFKDDDIEDKEYFIGSFVFFNHNDGNYQYFEVIDGQQRLTTILLIFAVIRDLTEDENVRKDINNYIIKPINTFENKQPINKIDFKIRDNVKEFVDNHVYKFDEKYDINKINDTYNKNMYNDYSNSNNISLRNMYNAMLCIKEYFSSGNYAENKEKMNNFINNVQKVVAVYVAANNRDNAFIFFNVLNARGIPLLASDILKAENLSAFIDKDKEMKYAEKWEDIESNFGNDFNMFLSHIRDIYVRKHAKQSLLKEFETIYKDAKLEKGEKTIEVLEKYTRYYKKIITLEELDENKCPNNLSIEYKNFIHILEYFQISEWKAPLLFYYDKFKEEKLLDFLKKMEDKMLCDIIVGLYPSARSQHFYDIINLIDKSSVPEEVIHGDAMINYNKKKAIQIIKEEGIYGRRYVKYILLKYEYIHSDNSNEVKYKDISIEHILPVNPQENSKWQKDFNDNEYNRWIDNIANLVLVSGKKNSSLSNLDFDDKKIKFKNKISNLIGAMDVFNKDCWIPSKLEERNEEIINTLFGEYNN